MAEISFQGKTFEVDEDGFLLRFDDWCPEWMEFVKESEGIAEITADHQKILDFLQDYYKKNGIAPMVRILSKNTGYKLKEVYELFPSGPGIYTVSSVQRMTSSPPRRRTRISSFRAA